MDKENIKPRNAPGSRLAPCKATVNVRLLKLETGEVLVVNFPLLSAQKFKTHEQRPPIFVDYSIYSSTNLCKMTTLMNFIKSMVYN